MKCKYCQSDCIRKGKRGNIQKYRCTNCGKYSQNAYRYKAYDEKLDSRIVLFVKEGLGIRSISRIQEISPKTVIARILKIGDQLRCPFPIMQGKSYEVDELFTYIGSKETGQVCIVYSLERDTRFVVSLAVGKRTKENLLTVIQSLLLRNAKRIATDGLNIYPTIIPKEQHCTKRRCTNRIERMNLNLRTHLKRLNRKTICYSKSAAMLLAVVKIYFWG